MREWVTELTKSLFSEDKGIFKQIKINKTLSYFPNSKAKYIYESEFQDYYRFAGQVLAKALFEKIPVLVNLNKIMLKKLVGLYQNDKYIVLDDLKNFDEQIYNSVKFMAEDPSIDYENEDFTFTIMKDDGEEIELIPNGKTIKVNHSNKSKYAKKVARYYLSKDVK